MVAVLEGAAQLVTGASTSQADGVCTGVALVISDGNLREIGDAAGLRSRWPDATKIDCSGCVITPGLVDSHTHAVFGGWRAAEYALRARGVSYLEIARQGGGINASVRDVRALSEDDLLERTLPRLAEVLDAGITTVEVKSGYGLSTEHELKQLRVVKRAAERTTLDLVPTFLGAHDFPPEFRDRRTDYVDLIIQEMIPAVASEKLAHFCDVFMEPGVFDRDQARRILEAGREHGLIPRLHADEFENSGGAELAAELGAASADHLGAISEAGIRALAASNTVATLLPATLFFLGKKNYAPARALVDAGAAIALATDFNPGTAPSSNLALGMTLACSHMGLDPLEALVAATAGGARALQLDDGRGYIRQGAPADLVVWSVSDHREIPYRFGAPPIREVWKRGVRVARRL
jgi:imidazolonepropionase